MPNRLATETSPYLLQHAGNPVDWFPWGEEALRKSMDEDRPILLSIGYSACHWCHVMERESFEDEKTAGLMNEGFVNIKVDREERPDLDSIYMKAVQASVGRGGWPLTAFLTPDGRFFYGGTYFPPVPTHGMPSFQQVLSSVLDAFKNRREQIEEGSNQVLRILESTQALRGKVSVGDDADRDGVDLAELARKTTEAALQGLASQHDPMHGGFGSAPKFPQPSTLEFLLRHFHQTGQREALEMVLTTLRAMARGGIWDHLEGGFHRYSVDARWLVPHFEKMLYDNGLLASLYLQAYQTTGNPELKEVVTGTLDYVMEDLRDPRGGFYSARDADSEGEEGTFYLWSPQEVEEVLGPEEAALFGRVYDVTPGGNFEGRTILNLPGGMEARAESEGMPAPELASRMEAARKTLKEARATREQPFRDEKVLTSWNSFVLRALAEAGGGLGRTDYVDAARENAEFILRELFRDGRVLRSWKDGDSRIHGFLEDYAGLGNALLALYEATLEPRWLEEAEVMAHLILELFWDEGESLFFDSPKDGEKLVVRAREIMDNATPSGNSLAVELLLRLSSFNGREDFRGVAERILRRESEGVSQFPSAFGRLLSALTLSWPPPTEVVILGDPESPEFQDLLATAHRDFIPTRVVAGGRPDSLPSLPLLEGREVVGGRATAYVCQNFTCSLPVHEPEDLSRELDGAHGKLSGF